MTRSFIISLLPLTFVVLWASAFVSAKAIMADATAFAALSLRFVIVTSIFMFIFLSIRQKQWLTFRQIGHAAVSGLCLHGFYLGGVFWALSHGLSATLAALIASLQPIFVALLAGPLLKERISRMQWSGIAMGFTGAVIVIGFDIGKTIPLVALCICILALGAAITGTLYQKRFGQDVPLIAGNLVQAFAASLWHLMMMTFIEVPSISFTSQFIIGMSWQILAVSLGAYVMLLILLKRGTAHQTSSLLFLTAPVAAIQAWLILSETLTLTDITGLIVASIGVFLATRAGSTNRPAK